MQENFSSHRRALIWRDLWIALAECQKDLGLDISGEQISALKDARERIDLDRVAELEGEFRHDVMAHIHAYGEEAPEAKGILHLGATSCFVADGSDLVQMRAALRLLQGHLLEVVRALSAFCETHKDLPVLGFTHFQPAQPTTLGKRASLWLQDFLMDLEDLESILDRLPFRGVKGTTGTQASFMELFDGDEVKVQELDRMVCERLGFPRTVPVCGQTYPRKWDARVLAVVSGIAASASKFAVDVRLMAHLRELEEPFGAKQVGSSAMPYKRNPMKCERIGGLSRYLLHLAPNAQDTAANQWLERTLDDSANRRLVIPESFLAADAILQLVREVASGMEARPKVIASHLERELPFMATETILMAATAAGGDRQELHEKIRVHSHAAADRLKEGDGENDLLERIANDPAFEAIQGDLATLVDPANFTGRASGQVSDFLKEFVKPLLAAREELSAPATEVGV
jgi:adenylosuccinate lyase